MSTPSKEKAVCKTCQYMDPEIVRCGRNQFLLYASRGKNRNHAAPDHQPEPPKRRYRQRRRRSGARLTRRRDKEPCQNIPSRKKIVIAGTAASRNIGELCAGFLAGALAGIATGAIWEDQSHKRYIWDDLDGLRPTMEEYKEQEARKCGNTN